MFLPFSLSVGRHADWRSTFKPLYMLVSEWRLMLINEFWEHPAMRLTFMKTRSYNQTEFYAELMNLEQVFICKSTSQMSWIRPVWTLNHPLSSLWCFLHEHCKEEIKENDSCPSEVCKIILKLKSWCKLKLQSIYKDEFLTCVASQPHCLYLGSWVNLHMYQ